jgi:L-ascorbate metabolism protein UlaG (beta-lactamase superfamily)
MTFTKRPNRAMRVLLKGLFILAIPLVVAGCHLFQVIGALPEPETAAAYEKLPYYREGHFQSPEELPHYPDRVTGGGPSGWSRFLLPNPHAPQMPLPQVTLDKTAFGAPSAELAIYWLGHSSLVIELEGKRLLVDPVFGNAAPLPGIVRRFGAAPLKREDIPSLDYVLITHDHYDHLEYATMRALRERETRFIVPFGVGAHLKKWGIPDARIHEIGWGETYEENGLVIASERAIHYSGRTFGRRNTTLWTSYALKGQEFRVFISGDGGYGAHFQDIGARHGPFDLACIEIDGWNPGWPRTHMFPEEVIRAYHDIGAQALLPVHWGVFDLARHPWDESIRKISELADQDGRVTLLTPLMGERAVPGKSVTKKWWILAPEDRRQESVSLSPQEDNLEEAMSEAIKIELANGAHQVSLRDLEQIKQALLEVLKRKTPVEDYIHLVKELEAHSVPMITPDGVGRIGGWRLKVEDQAALLERQQMPRTPLMRFYEARLTVENEHWRVSEIRIVHVRGRQ